MTSVNDLKKFRNRLSQLLATAVVVLGVLVLTSVAQETSNDEGVTQEPEKQESTNQDQDAETAQPANQSITRISTIEGATFESSVESIDGTGIVSGSGLDQPLNLDGISTITTGKKIVPQSSKFWVRLVGGSRMLVNRLTMAGDKYQIQTAAANFELGPESIQAIISYGDVESSLLNRLIGEPDSAADRVVAKSSAGEQAVAGLLKEITDDRIQIEFRGQVRPISFSKITGIILTDLRQTLPEGTKVRLQTIDGSTFVAVLKQLQNGILKLGLAGGADVDIDWNKVARLSIQSDRVTYLSDLEPTDVQERAFGASHFGWHADQNVFGETLTLFDTETSRFKEQTRGLGTHSYCQLQYSISEIGATQFSAMVGLDARAKHRGDCEVTVVADGIELWSGHIQGRQAPQQVNVDVTGIDRLTLTVKQGEHLDLGDHVNWVNARLLKAD